MKYYIYISDHKIDMLAGQISENKLKAIARQLQLSVQLPWAPIGVGLKLGDPLPSDSHRIKRLQVVEKAFKADEIGDIADGRPWIKSSLSMSWGFIDDEQRTIWFIGEDSDISIVMGGSAKHLLGGLDVNQQPHHAYSLLPVLTKVLVDRAEVDGELAKVEEKPSIVAAARLLTTTVSGPREQLSFIARRLITGEDNTGKLILATPLYVASSPDP